MHVLDFLPAMCVGWGGGIWLAAGCAWAAEPLMGLGWLQTLALSSVQPTGLVQCSRHRHRQQLTVGMIQDDVAPAAVLQGTVWPWGLRLASYAAAAS
jgi:hypothetical protein